jgi:hypothetical protein
MQIMSKPRFSRATLIVAFASFAASAPVSAGGESGTNVMASGAALFAQNPTGTATNAAETLAASASRLRQEFDSWLGDPESFRRLALRKREIFPERRKRARTRVSPFFFIFPLAFLQWRSFALAFFQRRIDGVLGRRLVGIAIRPGWIRLQRD